MTPRQLEILQHALGLDEFGQGTICRNFFCAGAGDEPICRELVAMGHMQQHKTTALYPYYNCSVTKEGKAAVRRDSPKPPKLTRSQKNYRAFLKADTGFSFREWLTRSKEMHHAD